MARLPKRLSREQRGLGASAVHLLQSSTPTRPVPATIGPAPAEPPTMPKPPRDRMRKAPALTRIPAPAFPSDPGEQRVDPGYEDVGRVTRREAKTAMRLDTVAVLKERALIEATALRAYLTDQYVVPWTKARNETEWWRALREAWRPYRAASLPTRPRYFLTRFEAAQTSGVPDLLILDQPTGSVAWIEMKFRKFPYNWPKAALNLGLSPAQAVWLWRWRRNGGQAGVLCGTTAGVWLWVPAHAAPEWPERVMAPNGWMTVPHVVGSGPVPEPAVLWRLPADLAAAGGTPSKPMVFTAPTSHVSEVTWPSATI